MNVLGILFSNIHDDQLLDLTTSRTTASIPYGGRYRLIDFILSNLVNAEIYNIAIITKFNYYSLMDHLETGNAWDLNRKNGGLSIFPPYACNTLKSVYRGKLEALIGIRKFLEHSKQEYVILSDCNIVCSLDVKEILNKHIDTCADITVVYHSVRHIHENDLVLKLDKNENVCDMHIALKEDVVPSHIGLGIYILKRSFLLDIVENAYTHGGVSFEKDYLLKNYNCIKLSGYETTGYASTINSTSEYFESSMDLLHRKVRKELFYQNGRIYTQQNDSIPAKYGPKAVVKNSLVADGSVIEGNVENSIIFRGVKIAKGAYVNNSILMQSAEIEEDAQIEYIIADKNVRITKGRILVGAQNRPYVIKKEEIV